MSFDPTPLVPPFPPRGEADPAITRLVAILDIEKFQRQYLFGLRLKDAKTNSEIKAEDLRDFIANAVSRVEHEARLNISPVKYTDLLDYNSWDNKNFCFLQLNHWPVLQVESVKAKFPGGSSDFLQFPSEWISCQNEVGMLQIAPRVGSGTVNQLSLTSSGSLLPLAQGRSRWPQLFEVVYTSGFEADKMPPILRDLIGLYAALGVLELLDSTTFSGSYSLSIDGTSQSVGLPGPGWLQSRITATTTRAEKQLDTVKRYYNHSLLLTSF